MNGNCEIRINGQTVGLKFGLPAMSIIHKKTALIENLDDAVVNQVLVAHILSAGYINHCIIKEIEPTLEFESFVDFVEEGGINESVGEDLKKVMKVFNEAKEVRAAKITSAITEKKSRLNGTTSKEPVTENLD
jgi:hypothetical protein